MKPATTIRTFLASLFNRSIKVEVQGMWCRVEGIEYRPLHRRLAQLPGVIFDRKPRYFWTGTGVYAEFVFKGHTFLIESDSWDGVLEIWSKDKLEHPDELREIGEHVEKFAPDASS